MKKIILCSLLLSLIPALGDAAAPTNAPAPPTSTATAAPLPDPVAKARELEIRTQLVNIARGGDSSQAAWDAVDAKIDAYQKDFGMAPQTTNLVVFLRRVELAIAKKSADPTRYQALLQQLEADPLPAVANMAKAEQARDERMAALKSHPLDLKYTAVDGTAVDLSTMRGKVVLIDFWATWCGPCRGEVPNVVAAYQKYHNQGFEVVGVSLDRDKDKLLAFTQENAMVWPQYFDGKGWNNEISQGFGINSIPAMWLVGKDGMLVTDNAREDLAGQVAKALAAP